MSEWFSVEELLCRCGRADCDALQTVTAELLRRADECRRRYGAPMIVTSGLRCRLWNDRVGGRPDSEHLTGEALDIRCTSSTNRYALLDAAFQAGFRRVGLARNFLHLGVSHVLAQDVLWTYPPKAAPA